MIEIKEKKNCCGCGACTDKCPKQCIKMELDNEGFLYPVVDESICINCGLCDKICPQNEVIWADVLESTEYYAAYNKDDDILKSSSSGGFFWECAKNIIELGGVVYGVIQSDTYNVTFAKAESLEEAEAMRGSKYLQAVASDVYSRVQKDLESGRAVLFSGTPCQVAALRKSLGKDYDKLYTIDVVCHGVPSGRVYKEFIDYTEKSTRKNVVNVKWRDKVKGWGPNRVTLHFSDGSSRTTISDENPFQRGFLRNLYLRPSCYSCNYARLPRIADISLADFWCYEGRLNDTNKNKGISLVAVSTQKGKELFNSVNDSFEYHCVEENYAKAKSRHLHMPPEENNSRDNFFADLENKPYEELLTQYGLKDSRVKTTINGIKRLKHRLFD